MRPNKLIQIGGYQDDQRFHAQLAGQQFDAVIDTIAYDAAAVSAALRTFTAALATISSVPAGPLTVPIPIGGNIGPSMRMTPT